MIKKLTNVNCQIPRSIIKYPLDISVSMGRLRVRTEWERYRNVTNLDVLNVLLVKGTQELIETHNKWKQRVHVMRFFDNPKWDQLAQTALQPTPGVGLLQEEAKSPFIREFLRK